MLIQAPILHHQSFLFHFICNKPNTPKSPPAAFPFPGKSIRINVRNVRCHGRRRVRYDEDDDEEDYGHNEDIAMLESYSKSAWSEAFLVTAMVDGEEEVVLIFRGFSSCLSSRTAADPSKSVLPEKAMIKSIDVIRGPFDPSNIEYLEKDLTWEEFKTRFQSNKI